jgi:hypothetical protein
MSKIIAKKIISNRSYGLRGDSGFDGNNGSLGPIGLNPEGLIGDSGNPGPTCACRFDQDIPEVRAILNMEEVMTRLNQ